MIKPRNVHHARKCDVTQWRKSVLVGLGRTSLFIHKHLGCQLSVGEQWLKEVGIQVVFLNDK